MFRGMNPVKVYRVESSSKPGMFYYVVEWPNGKYTCNCKAFTTGRQQRGKDVFERSCKHTLQIIQRPPPKPRALPRRPRAQPEEVEIDPKIESLITEILKGS